MEMNERELTDIELITALNKCSEKTYCEEKCEYRLAEMGSACIPKLMGQALDLIRRLQYGYSSASKASDEWREKYEAVLKDYYAEKQTCDEQKAEIERLTEENKAIRINCENARNITGQVLDKNDELQKKVDVLKAEKENLYFLNKNLEDYIDNHEPILKRNTEQAVKDTAKEVYTQVLEWLPVGEDYSVFLQNIETWIKERYGVEVE